MKIRAIHITSRDRLHQLRRHYAIPTLFQWPQQFLFELKQLHADQSLLLDHLAEQNPQTVYLFSALKGSDRLIGFSPNASLLREQFAEVGDREVREFLQRVAVFLQNDRSLVWNLGTRQLDFSKAPLIMGILNVTPDSFSDGGRYVDTGAALEQALAMEAAGADIIDVGGESTRPGAAAVSEEEEMQRVLPVIEQIRRNSNVVISIDTYKSAIAKAALKAGADMINDISAATFDSRMAEVAVRHKSPLIAMHIKGTPRNMQDNPSYEDVCAEIYTFLESRILALKAHGIERIMIDPGIGFGKRLQDNLKLLQHLRDLTFLDAPILIGVSRKSFIGKVLNKEVHQRLVGSLAAALIAVQNGAKVIRVHDVAETNEVLHILRAIGQPQQFE